MEKKKRKFKMPTAFTTLLIITFILALLTYIIPAGVYKMKDGIPVVGTYHHVAANHQSLWDVFNAPIKGFTNALEIALFLLVLGGFLGVVFETKAIEAGLQRVVARLKGREKLLIPVLMILFALGGTTFGMAEETLAFYPLIVPVVLAAGYDLVTAIMIIFLGSGVGFLGGLTDPFSVGIASELSNISMGDGIIKRAILLVVALTFTILFVMHYAEKVKKDPTKSVVYGMKEKLESKFSQNYGADEEEIPFTFKRKVILTIFALTFVMMVVSIIPWQDKFGIDFFADLNKQLTTLPVLNLIFGHMKPFGTWYFGQITTLFFISAVIIGLIYRFKEDELVDLFVNGARDLLGVALVLGVARGISIILQDGLIIGTILNFGEHLLKGIGSGVFSIATFILYMPLSFLIPSSSGLATATIPIIAPLADFAHVSREIVIMAFQTGSQFMNFISPTQCVLIAALTFTGVPYGKWIKSIIPFLIGLFLIVCTALIIFTI